MNDARVTAVRSVELGVRDVGAAARFYNGVWNVDQVAEDNGARYFRGTGPEHHILALHEREEPALVRVNFAAPDRRSVDGLHGRLSTLDLPELGTPAALTGPGGGYGFAFEDKEGRRFAVSSDLDTHDDDADARDRPRKISHCVLNAADMEGSIAIFTDGLGFTVSDRTGFLCFLRCNSDHHSIALGPGSAPTLHHIAFEMADLDSVMRGAGRMREAGYPIEWGVGRHGPGANVFSYFLGPDDYVIEYTAEVEQVDDSYPKRSAEYWASLNPPGRSDRWGVTDPPSERMKAAQSRIAFA